MKLPKKLKAWGHDYEIEFPHRFSNTPEPLAGLLNAQQTKILIDDTDALGNECSESVVWVRLFHELIHLVITHSGHDSFLLENNEPNEEGIDAHAEAWYMILNDNGLLRKPK